MKKLTGMLLLACGLAAAQAPTPTTLTILSVREYLALAGKVTSTSPCPLVLYIPAGSPSPALGCWLLGPGMSWTPGPVLNMALPIGSTGVMSAFVVSAAGTQTFPCMSGCGPTWPSAAQITSLPPAHGSGGYFVWRNGILLAPFVDYATSGTVAGSTVTLAAAQATQVGDVIQIW